jgi:putative ABC transport system permease protein
VDKDVPIVREATMTSLAKLAVADRRFALVLFEAFGIAALILVTTGIYGVLSGSVTERTHEIGVRAALGAAPLEVVGLVVRDGLAVAIVGVIAGLGAAAVATRAMGALLFGISPLDPITYVAVIAMLLGASAVACAAPAYRAASIDPSRALRAE